MGILSTSSMPFFVSLINCFFWLHSQIGATIPQTGKAMTCNCNGAVLEHMIPETYKVRYGEASKLGTGSGKECTPNKFPLASQQKPLWFVTCVQPHLEKMELFSSFVQNAGNIKWSSRIFPHARREPKQDSEAWGLCSNQYKSKTKQKLKKKRGVSETRALLFSAPGRLVYHSTWRWERASLVPVTMNRLHLISWSTQAPGHLLPATALPLPVHSLDKREECSGPVHCSAQGGVHGLALELLSLL